MKKLIMKTGLLFMRMRYYFKYLKTRKYKILKTRYRFIGHDKVYRIKACRNFNNVKKGDIGGYIGKHCYLAQTGKCWIYDDAIVNGATFIKGNSIIKDNAHINGRDIVIRDNCRISGYVVIAGENITIAGNSIIRNQATINSNVAISCNSYISGPRTIIINARLCNAFIESNDDFITFTGFGRVNRTTTISKTRGKELSVCCGCFHGNIKKFEQQVMETHEEGSYRRDEYLEMIKLAEIHF